MGFARETMDEKTVAGADRMIALARHPNIYVKVSALPCFSTSILLLSVPPPTASWGTMLNDGRAHLFDAPHLVLFPALAVMLAVLSFNFIGDALRDYLDPRSRIEAGL